jgi:hypothetical protein
MKHWTPGEVTDQRQPRHVPAEVQQNQALQEAAMDFDVPWVQCTRTVRYHV